MLIFDTLGPVVLVIALGALLQRSGFLPKDFLKDANRLAYWVGLPALLIHDLANSPLQFGAAWPMLEVTLFGCACAVAGGYAVAAALKVRPGAVGSFVQGSFRGNLAFIGLPIIHSLPKAVLPNGLDTEAAAVLVIGPAMVVYNVVAIVVLLLSQHAFSRQVVKPLLRQLATTPPLIASVVGIGLAEAHLPLPAVLNNAIGGLGDMALPLGMLGIGGALVTMNLGAAWKAPLAAALVKTVVAPVAGVALALWLGLPKSELRVALVFLAAPTAIISYPMAVELKGDLDIAAGAIAWSVLTSLPALTLALALTG